MLAAEDVPARLAGSDPHCAEQDSALEGISAASESTWPSPWLGLLTPSAGLQGHSPKMDLVQYVGLTGLNLTREPLRGAQWGTQEPAAVTRQGRAPSAGPALLPLA